MRSLWLNSFTLIYRQNRFTYFILLIIGIFGVFAVVLTNPGEAGLQAYLGIEESVYGKIFLGDLLEGLGSENSAFYLYFVLLYFILYLGNAFPIVGLWLGGTGIPEEISTNMADIFIASSHKKEKLVFRHLMTHGIIFTILTVIMFLTIPISYELLDTPINYERILLAYILLWISGVTFFSISFFFSIVTLRSDLGRGIAGLVFMLSFLVQLIVNLNSDLDDLKYLNLLHYLSSNSILLEGDPLILENILPILLAGILIIFGVLIFGRRDLLPLQLRQESENIITDTETKSSLYDTLRRKFVIRDYIKSTLQRVSPISAEQWTADRTIIIFFLIFSTLVALSIIFGYPTGEGGTEQYSGIYANNPFVKSIQRDYADSLVEDPLYTIYTQFYGYTWIYFFPLVIIAAARIVERDNDSKTLDLILGTPIKQKKVFFARILTILVQISIFAIIVVTILIFGEFLLEVESKILEQVFSIALIIFTYGSLLCFLIAVGIAFPIPHYRKRVIYGIGGLTIALAVIPYFNEAIMPLKYFSLLYYFDLIGLINLGYQIEQLRLLLVLFVVLIASISFINYKSDRMVLI